MRLDWDYDTTKHEISFKITPENRSERVLLEMCDYKTPCLQVGDKGELVVGIDLRTDH